MSIRINEQKYKSSFGSKNRFEHNKGTNIKLFPFATDTKFLPESEPDFKAFHGFTGKFYRDCFGISIKSNPTKADLLNSIASIVDTKHEYELKDIVSELIFDESDNIYLFSEDILPYLNLLSDNPKLKNLQNFISNLLIDDEVKSIVKSSEKIKDNNVFYNLIIDQLKRLSNIDQLTDEYIGYYNGKLVLEIRSQFKIDLKNLINLEEFYLENIPNLIKYYYLQYIIRLSFQLRSFFNDNNKIEPLFFTLQWEKLSRSRFALENGWKKLEDAVYELFAHANCLEMLNTIDFSKEHFSLNAPFTYIEIAEAVKVMDEESEKDFTAVVNQLISRYYTNIQDVNWNDFETKFTSPPDPIYLKYHSLSKVYYLFSMIKYQFENSPRNSTFKGYNMWFKSFVKANYYKFRGSLGGTMKIDRDVLLLFTELSILSNGQDKIVISKLWIEFEKRGLFLDDKSKHEVVAFFEKINTLEKRSDSGDAQYVTRLYKNENGTK